MEGRVRTIGEQNLACATRLAVVAMMAMMLLLGIACAGPQPTPHLETPTRLPIDGATWILESIDGQPPIKGTHLTLALNEPWFGGFDGCNDFGGRHESGKSVIGRNGTISVPPFAMTAAGCPTPAILEQAKRYLDSITQDAKARVADDRLHILDGSGQVALVFVREQPLPGQPPDLVGTSWRLVDDEDTYGGDATTILFLHSWAATGTTVCRDYSIGYTASEGRIRIPSKGMSGSGERCSSEVSRQEHQFIGDFGSADEYSIHQEGGSEQLEVRTSRGKTLTFEPLPQPADTIFEGQWRLIRFLESRSDGSGMRWPRDTDVGVSENITATFDQESIEGSLGRNSCAYRATGSDGASLVGENETISINAALVVEDSCDDGVSISPKQQRYLDVLPTAERYTVFGERLVIFTSDDGALVFQAE